MTQITMTTPKQSISTRIVAVRHLLLAVSLAGAGCASNAPHAPTQSESAQAARAADQATIVDLMDPTTPIPPEHFLQAEVSLIIPGDELEIRTYDNGDLSGLFLVPPDGKINLPFIGTVQVADKTPEQVDQEITAGLSAYFRNIDVMVNIKDPAQRSVFVIGQVQTPGRYEFAYGDRVLHAIGHSGGMLSRARETGVVLVRRDADGRDHAYRLDFSSMHTFVAPGDVYLQPGDIVFVPKSRFATFTEFADALLGTVNRALTAGVLTNDVFDIRARTISISNQGQ